MRPAAEILGPSTFLDTFRYLDQLGRLAKQGVQVVIHNTLAASDYGLIDQKTLKPRPNYWGALLWRRADGNDGPGFRCRDRRGVARLRALFWRGASGGVTLLAINNSRTETAIEVPLESKRYTLSAEPLRRSDVELNGETLNVDDGGDLPAIEGAATTAGSVSFAPERDHVFGDRAVRKLPLAAVRKQALDGFWGQRRSVQVTISVPRSTVDGTVNPLLGAG